MQPDVNLYQIAVELSAIAVPLIAGVLWINRSLERLKTEIAKNLLAQSVKDVEMAGQIEKLELYCNGNRESVEHTRNRMFQELDRLEMMIRTETVRNGKKIGQVCGWLAKNTTFSIRTSQDE